MIAYLKEISFIGKEVRGDWMHNAEAERGCHLKSLIKGTYHPSRGDRSKNICVDFSLFPPLCGTSSSAKKSVSNNKPKDCPTHWDSRFHSPLPWTLPSTLPENHHAKNHCYHRSRAAKRELERVRPFIPRRRR